MNKKKNKGYTVIPKQEIKEETKEKDLSVVINGIKYLPIKDYNKKMTLTQHQIAVPLLNELFEIFGEKQDFFKEFAENHKDDKDVNIGILEGVELLNLFQSYKRNNEILALLYLPEGQTRFNEDDYDKYKIEFKEIDMDDYERIGEVIVNFFGLTAKYQKVNIQIFSNLMKTGVLV